MVSHRGLKGPLLAGVAALGLAGCGGQAPRPEPEPRPLELVVSGVEEGGVYDGGVRVCVDVVNASSPLDASVSYSLSGPEGLRDAYVSFRVPEGELDGSVSVTVPVSGAGCVDVTPTHAGVYDLRVRVASGSGVPEGGLEASVRGVEVDKRQIGVYGWEDGQVVDPGERVYMNVASELKGSSVKGILYEDGVKIVEETLPLDDYAFSLPSGAQVWFNVIKAWLNGSGKEGTVELYSLPEEELFFRGTFFTR